MLYQVKFNAVITIGDMKSTEPLFFSISAKNRQEAETKFRKNLAKATLSFTGNEKFSLIGKDYSVEKNPNLKFCGLNFKENEIKKIDVLEETRQINIRTEKDCYCLALWGNDSDKSFNIQVRKILDITDAKEIK